MQAKSDAELLREHAGQASEAAFREIVRRHADLVYASALRQVRSPELARDITQGVFADLVRKAPSLGETLAESASLVGWLYRSTRYAAHTQMRNDRRRQARERQAMENFYTTSETATDWEQIGPVLDEAMADLSDEDREAILLRYFKNHDFRAIGVALGVSDDAAQKRVSRALERLRAEFDRRGVTIGAGALAAAVSANAVTVGPAGLAAALSTAALTGTTFTAATTATNAIVMTTLQKTFIMLILAAALTTPLFVQHRALATARVEQSMLLAKMYNAPIEKQKTLILGDVDDLKGREKEDLERLRREVATLRARISELASRLQSLDASKPQAQIRSIPIGETVRLAEAQDAGQSTPAALLQTYNWAMLHGDTNRLAQLIALSPETDTRKVQRLFEDVSKEATKGMDAILLETPLSEIRLLEEQPAHDDTRWILHEFVNKNGNIAKRARILVRPSNDGWKLVFGANGPTESEALEEQQ